jgi:hypothetical protein
VGKKCCTAGQATDDNMAHAHCMLDTQCYKYTHSEYVILNAFPLQQWLYERTSKPVLLLLILNVFTARYELNIRLFRP